MFLTLTGIHLIEKCSIALATVAGVAALVMGLGAGAAHAESDKTVKIGVLTDMSGVYADLAGPGSFVAAQMAVEESGLTAKGWTISVVSADHQNKPDIAGTIARQWIDVDKIDAILDVPNSGAALAVNSVVKDKNAIFINSGAATPDLTGSACTPNTIHWTYDTYLLSHGTGKAVVQGGGDSWFFLTADYAFGQALERDTSAVVTENGGKILGGVRHPLNTADFSSYLLQAQASKAKIIGLANAGGDTVNAIKQASEFGIQAGGQKLVPLLLFISDVNAMGLKIAQGLTFTESFYWDLNDQTRAFAARFAARMKNGAKPTMVHAGVYSGTLHMLKAMAALGGNPHDSRAVVAKMKELPTQDEAFGKGMVREDGRTIHPGYLFEVKTPDASKGPWDYYTLEATIPADEAFRPLAQSACPLVKK